MLIINIFDIFRLNVYVRIFKLFFFNLRKASTIFYERDFKIF
jgi:hypothetical protein